MHHADQVKQHCCPLFRNSLGHQRRIQYFCKRMRELVRMFALPNCETLYSAVADELGKDD